MLALSGAIFSAYGEVPRPEHPTPQLERSEWLNLNGEWEFAETDDSARDLHELGAQFPDKITVPFCRESKLSGLERKGFVKNVWYRRSFAVPAEWNSKRALLHIGACDWKTTVWVNGALATEHVGGNSPITADITDLLKRDAENVVVVHAYDDTQGGLQPTGKQSHEPESNGCVYTRTTGIWQTVWLEGVGQSYIRGYYVTPDIENGRISLRADVVGAEEGLTVEAKALAEGRETGSAKTSARNEQVSLIVDLADKRLWAPESPFLYGLELKLTKGGEVVDSVKGYFGLREITTQGSAILLNGKAVFQRLVLDQGFYPEGIWTAPAEDALKRDIEMSMAVGFNGARLHQKVFEPRFLYWADKIGYMVWGEYPSWGANAGEKGVDLPILTEWLEIVRRDRNHPAIVGWCPYNETGENWGPLQNTTVYATREADPTRPVLDSSGWVHSLSDPRVLDAHDYNQDPEKFRAEWDKRLNDAPSPPQYSGGFGKVQTPFFISEFGGIGWNVHGNGWGYGNAPKDLESFYTRFKGLADALLDNRKMFGFCYTQLTDIEQEQNGVYTYDRQPKFDVARLRAALSRPAAYETNPPLEKNETASAPWTILIGGVPDGDFCKAWKYAFEKPADDWTGESFDDSAWKSGKPGFGKKGGWESKTGTDWTTSDIWLRQTFDCANTEFARALLITHHDNDAEVYVNGKLIWSEGKWNDNYNSFDVGESLRAALKPGKNVVAVHCKQETGGQFFDMGLLTNQK
jgi:hypothetical protein